MTCWSIDHRDESLSDGYERGFALLPSDERQRALKMNHMHVRSRYVWGRILVRAVLAQILECDPTKLVLKYGNQGRPDLKSPQPARPFSFNISHTESTILLGVAHALHLGVDVERILPRRQIMPIAKFMYSPEEYAALQAIEDRSSQCVAFYRLWTLKEAAIKAYGQGLSGLRDISFLDVGKNAISCVHETHDEASNFEELGFGNVCIGSSLMVSAARTRDGNFRAGEKVPLVINDARDLVAKAIT